MSKAAYPLALLAAVSLLPTGAFGATRAGGEFTANTYTGNVKGFPSAAMLPDGGFVIAWRSLGQDGSDDGVFGQRFARDGSRLASEFRVNGYTTGAQRSPQAAPTAAGAFVVAWSGIGEGDSDGGIFARRRRLPAATAGRIPHRLRVKILLKLRGLFRCGRIGGGGDQFANKRQPGGDVLAREFLPGDMQLSLREPLAELASGSSGPFEPRQS